MENTPTETAPVQDGFIGSIDQAFADFDTGLDDAPEPKGLAEIPSGTEDDASGEQELETTTATETEEATETDSPLDELDGADDVGKDWTPQAARRFKQLKSELKSSKTRLSELESSLNEREARLKELEAIADNPEYDQLKNRVEEYEKELLVTKLESSQIYKELVAQPLAELVSETDAIAEKYQVDANELLDAIALEDEAAQEEALADILAAASDRDRFRVYKIIEQIKPILHQRSVLQENAQEALREAEQLTETQTKQQLAERAAERQKAASAVADKIRAKLTFLEGVDGVDFAALSKKVAETDPSTLNPVDAAFQSYAAQLLPKIAREYVSLRKELDTLTDKLSKYDRASPRAGGGGASSFTGAGPTADGRSFADAVNAAFGG
jgi:chromosome segregation ATPase